MSYTALYRKFRPQVFADVKGQDHIVRTLKNQIQANRIGHAYLFCGTRGTGKTTVAKIFAKAVNCENPRNGEPCGECAMCKSIAAGNSMNLVEIDAASNNGVDNVRDIIEQVSYSPTEGRYKVYIIDEVHMLSTAAFNALLKTLEEPPSYVIFILATTEVNKIPITVLSRCQEYDFHRVDMETLKARMRELLEIEGAKVEEAALSYIAKVADGSVRDSLSLLDQCMAFYMDQEVTLENVLEVLGAVDTEIFSKLFTQIEERNVGEVLNLVNQIVMQGRDLNQFVADFTWYMRNVLLLKNTDGMEDALDMSRDTIEQVRNLSQGVGSMRVIEYIRILSELSGQIRYSNQKRIMIEVAFIKMCRPQMQPGIESLVHRLNIVEEAIAKGGLVTEVQKQGSEAVKALLDAAPAPMKEVPKSIPKDVQSLPRRVREVASEMSNGLVDAFMKKAHFSLSGENVQIVLDCSLAYEFFNQDDFMKRLEEGVSEREGREVHLEVTYNNTGRDYNESFVDLEELIKMKVTIEEE